ncbi:MFS transporter [Jatrophihabitans sp. DSM 45814]
MAQIEASADLEAGLPGWRRNNYAAMLCVFLLTASFSFTTPFLPLYLRQLDGISGPQAALWAGIASGLGGLGSFVTGPIWGALGDRYGRKLMLVRASFGGATGLLLIGLATSVWQVVLFRMLIGVMAGAPAAAMALMATGTPRSLLPRALGHLQASTLIGVALGPVLAASLISALGYRTTFITAGILMFSGATVATFMIQEQRIPRPKPAAPGTVDPEVVAVAEVPRPGALRQMLRSRVVWAALGLVLSVSFAAPMIQPILAPYVGTLLPDGASTTATVGWLFFGISIASASAAMMSGRLIRRFGLQTVLLTATVGVALFLIPAGTVQEVWQLAVLVITMSLFGGALQTSTVALLPSVVDSSSVSSIFGLYQSASALSAQLGPALGGALAVAVGFRHVFPIAGTALLVLGLPMFVVFRRVVASEGARQSAAASVGGAQPLPS